MHFVSFVNSDAGMDLGAQPNLILSNLHVRQGIGGCAEGRNLKIGKTDFLPLNNIKLSKSFRREVNIWDAF